ncbi:MAG: shikimate kinase [Actinobacteria bacterium]|nr:shikimate kinase [Actinomycetota bacterium]
MRNIVFTGFMATGKTSVGRIVAQRLGLSFVDTDDEIERVTGRTVQEIFERYGSIRFRSEEALVIKKLSQRGGLVIATGGGAVLNPENVSVLKKNGVVVLLKTTPEIILRRVNSGRGRPLLAWAEDIGQRIKDLMTEREEVYAGSADLEVFTCEESREEVAAMVINMLRERKYI